MPTVCLPGVSVAQPGGNRPSGRLGLPDANNVPEYQQMLIILSVALYWSAFTVEAAKPTVLAGEPPRPPVGNLPTLSGFRHQQPCPSLPYSTVPEACRAVHALAADRKYRAYAQAARSRGRGRGRVLCKCDGTGIKKGRPESPSTHHTQRKHQGRTRIHRSICPFKPQQSVVAL